MMNIRFFLEYQNRIMQLPVNPAELEINTDGSNKTMEIVKLGEVNQLRERKLRALKIESFLPQREEPPFVLTKGKFELPQAYIDFFGLVQANKKPMRLIITGLDVNMMVSIESLLIKHVAGDGDVWFKLELKEYRSYVAKEVQITVNNGRPKSNTQPTNPVREEKGFAIGNPVIVNGRYYGDSFGGGGSGTFNNFRGVISHIVAVTSRKYRYHIKTVSGSSRGWVSVEQLRHK